MAQRIWVCFVVDADTYRHLAVTLTETLLAFVIGSGLGPAAGRWLALSPTASALLAPYVKALHSMPRIIPRRSVILANARMLGASNKQLLRHVYLPSATS